MQMYQCSVWWIFREYVMLYIFFWFVTWKKKLKDAVQLAKLEIFYLLIIVCDTYCCIWTIDYRDWHNTGHGSVDCLIKGHCQIYFNWLDKCFYNKKIICFTEQWQSVEQIWNTGYFLCFFGFFFNILSIQSTIFCSFRVTFPKICWTIETFRGLSFVLALTSRWSGILTPAFQMIVFPTFSLW